MKTRTILLLAALALTTASLTNAATNSLKPTAPSGVQQQQPTPEFDRFLVRLRECRGFIRSLAQWRTVLKPTLEQLGYNQQEVEQTKAALCKNAVTLTDVRLFSERWMARYQEQVSPQDICEFFSGGKKPSAPTRF